MTPKLQRYVDAGLIGACAGRRKQTVACQTLPLSRGLMDALDAEVRAQLEAEEPSKARTERAAEATIKKEPSSEENEEEEEGRRPPTRRRRNGKRSRPSPPVENQRPKRVRFSVEVLSRSHSFSKTADSPKFFLAVRRIAA